MPIGTIHIQTFSGGVLPGQGVYINITDAYGTTVAEFFTDENGDSTPVEVYTPPKELSLDPNNLEQPYSIYDVYAWKQGYEDLQVWGVQAFEGQESLEQLNLQPTEFNNEPSAQSQDYDIPEHHLLDPDAPASSTGPLDDCTSSRVLTQVVIPEYITVHLGKPSASAANVTVTFKDYIKNVASSEIYPTWPEQSLRANIYCQISLALNRVYTEWYRSKGYSFQITNSTSYDQYFVNGRNIFDNISKIVDEIFATYIQKTGTVNPFYAEYCDGKSVTCPGLKQWGTVTLAEQGYTAFNILKYYYGSNIQLVTSKNLAAIPQSYPGSPLTIGSTGSNVRIIQRQLNRISQNYPSFGSLTVDGSFGQSTADVVKKFQKQFSLTQDGIVGYSTWYKISYIYVAVKQLAELGSEGEYPNDDSVSDAEGVWPGTILTVGSTGTSVKQVQYWLNTVRGYISGLPYLNVDGIYGSGTAAAVKTFQTWAGLTADGVVGVQTWNALYEEFVSVILEEDTELGYVTQYPGTALTVGSTGNPVRSVQFWLTIISDSYGAVPSVSVDGVYGAATKAAVIAFQNLFGLTADGIVGQTTWNKLREIFVAVVLTLVEDNAYPGTYPGSPLRQGSSGTAVREMQYYLYVLSVYYASIPTIAYDGKFGSATTQAVVAFQDLFGLTPDGVVGPATWSAIYAAYIRLITVEGASRSSAQPAYTFELGIGSEGTVVLWVQRVLNFISRFYPMIQQPIEPQNVTGQPVTDEPGAFDVKGVYGEYTAEAVKSFQKEFSLEQTGTVNAITWENLLAIFESCNAEDLYGEWDDADGSYPQAVLQTGSYGPLVTQVQDTLNELAQNYCELSFVPDDGVFKDETLEAVKRFQKKAVLPVSGSVTSATWQAMRDALPDAGGSCKCRCTCRGGECECACTGFCPEDCTCEAECDCSNTTQTTASSCSCRKEAEAALNRVEATQTVVEETQTTIEETACKTGSAQAAAQPAEVMPETACAVLQQAEAVAEEPIVETAAVVDVEEVAAVEPVAIPEPVVPVEAPPVEKTVEAVPVFRQSAAAVAAEAVPVAAPVTEQTVTASVQPQAQPQPAVRPDSASAFTVTRPVQPKPENFPVKGNAEEYTSVFKKHEPWKIS